MSKQLHLLAASKGWNLVFLLPHTPTEHRWCRASCLHPAQPPYTPKESDAPPDYRTTSRSFSGKIRGITFTLHFHSTTLCCTMLNIPQLSTAAQQRNTVRRKTRGLAELWTASIWCESLKCWSWTFLILFCTTPTLCVLSTSLSWNTH